MNALVEPGLQEAVGESVILVSECQVGEGGGELVGLEGQCPGARQSAAADSQAQDPGKDPLLQGHYVAGAFPEEQDQPHGRENQRRRQKDDVSGGEVVGQGVQSGVEDREVRHGKGRHPVEQNEAVDTAGYQPANGDEHAPKHPPPEKQRGSQCDQHDQGVHQQSQGTVRHELHEGGETLRKSLMVEKLHHSGNAQSQKGIEP